MSMNIRSMKLNFDAFMAYVENILCDIDILILGEVNINDSEKNMFNVPGFNMFTSLRKKRRGGGIILYVKNGYNFELLTNVFYSCEGVHGVVNLNNSKTHILAIYRPPDYNSEQFFLELDKIVNVIDNKHQVLLAGDININLNDEENINVQRYNVLMSSHGMRRCIFGDTRVEERQGKISCSSIDHIFVRVNNIANDLHSAIIQTKISDHFITVLGLSKICSNLEISPSQTLEKKIINENKLKNMLKQINWERFSNITDPCEMYDKMYCEFKNAYLACERFVTTDDKVYKRNAKPWITAGLKAQMIERDKLFKKMRNSKNNLEYKKNYKKARNKIIKELAERVVSKVK